MFENSMRGIEVAEKHCKSAGRGSRQRPPPCRSSNGLARADGSLFLQCTTLLVALRGCNLVLRGYTLSLRADDPRRFADKLCLNADGLSMKSALRQRFKL